MARHKKATVDYFPHYVHHGKTLHIIQNLYGNDGYAFFYKLLELLGDAEGHYYDCQDETSKEFLAVKTNVPWISGAGILDKLSIMGIIDMELWENGVIWMQSFVESIKDAYRKRSISVPEKPQVSEFLPPEIQKEPIDTAGSTQSKVNKSKVNKKQTDKPSFALPKDIDSETWKAFEEMRKKIKAPLTDKARSLIVADLERIGQDKNRVLEQSIEKAWRGVFPLKDQPAIMSDHPGDEAAKKLWEIYGKRKSSPLA